MPSRLPRRLSPGERLSRHVVLALDAFDGPVAVKIAAGPEPHGTRELAQEFERMAALCHPGIPRAGSFGFLGDGRAFLTMERATGEVPVGPMDWDDLARVADGLCEALSYLHSRGLVHRDVKPEHVRFDAASGRVMLLDYGAASQLLEPSGAIGTPGYMAPEVVVSRAADERSDLYALGVLLHELATGRAAFTGDVVSVLECQRAGRIEPLDSLRPDAPQGFSRLVSRLVSPAPSARPSCADACRDMIAEALGTAPGPRLGSPPVIGRERELDALRGLAERARVHAVAAALCGPAGSGRTSVLEALRATLLLSGIPVLQRSARGASLVASLARDVSLVLDIPVACGSAERMDEALAALRSASSALDARDAARGPLVLLIDDADRASRETRGEIAALAGALPAGVLLIVADEAGDALLGAEAPRVDLGPLPEASVRRLLEVALRDAPSSAAVSRALSSARQPGDILATLRGSEHAGPTSPPAELDAEALLRRGHVSASVSAWNARVQALGEDDAAGRARALAGLALALWAMAEPADALARAEAALALAAQAGDSDAEARAAIVLGRIYASFGSTRDGVGWQRRALELAQAEAQAPRHAAQAELGLLMIREGHLEAAMRVLTEAAQDADSCGDRAGAALARVRLGRARFLSGDLGGGERLLRRALAEATTASDALVDVEARRAFGAATCALGGLEEGLALLDKALDFAVEAGLAQELPALHEACALAHLRRAVRLRTPTGAIVDRRRLEVARAHVEKGLDLALATGRMADRAALAVLAARCSLLLSDDRAALAGAEEAHVLALEAGDLLVATQCRLVKSEAMLGLREFGVALAEARIACEAFERGGGLEDAWRAHAVLARIHAAWGMAAKQAAETEAAARILRKLEATLREPVQRRAYLADVERAAALAPPTSSDAAKVRRGAAPDITGSRFAGRADTEDLVDALIRSQKRLEALERRHRTARCAARDARLRRDGLLLASELLRGGPPVRTRDLARVLDLVSRACGGARVVLATSRGERIRVRGISGARASCEAATHETALAVARRVVETAEDCVSLGTAARLGADLPGRSEAHVGVALRADGDAFGAIVARAAEGRGLRRSDVRLLKAVAGMLSKALAPTEEPVAAGA